MRRIPLWPALLSVLILFGCNQEGGAEGQGAGGAAQVFDVQRTDAKGVQTSFKVEVEELKDGLLHLIWRDKDGEQAYEGYALPITADLYTVGFEEAPLKSFTGIYRRGAEGWAGIWTNGFLSGQETWGAGAEPPTAKAIDLPDDIKCLGHNPDGSSYEGTISVVTFNRPAEQGFQLNQDIPGQGILIGYGLMTEGHIAAVYQLQLDLTVQYYSLQPDGTWSGKWYTSGGVGMGDETLSF